jgi:ATP-dependent helicase/nuclease subunit A
VIQALLADGGRRLPHELLVAGLTELKAWERYTARLAPGDPEATLVHRNLLRLVELCMRFEDDGLTGLAPLLARLEALAASDELGSAEAPADAVTLMTIHKAKGLEFPLVALVDTGRPWGKKDLYWVQGQDGDGRPGVYFTGRREEQPLAVPAFKRLAELAAAGIQDECQRLLYVALTRARQYLVVTGHEGGQGLPGTVVYGQISRAFAARTTDAWASGLPEWSEVWSEVWSELTSRSNPGDCDQNDQAGDATLPWTWDVDRTLPRELGFRSPSKHEGARGAGSGLTVLSTDPQEAVALGDVLHRGLEHLMRGTGFDGARALRSAMPDAPPPLVASVAAELAALAACPTLAELRRSSRRLETELPVVHRQGNELVSGTLDLLVEDQQGRLLVVDYKTTRFANPPALVGAAGDEALRRFCRERAYDQQLAAYAAAVQALHPAAVVRTAVYFTSLRRIVDLSGADSQAERARPKKPSAKTSERPTWVQRSLFDE